MPDLGLLHTLPLRIGIGPARQMLLHNGSVLAADALAMGLVDKVTEPDRALAEATALARDLAQSAPLAMAMMKSFLAEGVDAALERERHLQTLLYLSEDHASARAAYLEKRPLYFRGL
jgi:enoyl-CoA hydratase/carnithine racemase